MKRCKIGGVLIGLSCLVPIAPASAITNGMNVPDGSYPFLATVKIEGNPTNHTCAGTLIAPRLVLTYPVCLARGDGEAPAGAITVAVGRTVLSDPSQGQVRRVAKVHSEESTGGNPYVTVLELDTPVNGIEPIALVAKGSDEFQQPGQELHIIGWGETTLSLDAPPSDRLQFASMNVDNAACEDSGVTLCAKGQNGARVACVFDSGDPLFALNPSQQPRFVQVGMVREGWGIFCTESKPVDLFGKLSEPGIASYLAGLIARTPM